MVKLLFRITIIMILLLTGACGTDPSSEVLPEVAGGNYVPGEVLLRLRPAAGASRAAAKSAEDLLAGARVAERITIGGYRPVTAARAGVVSSTVPAIEILRLQLPDGMSVEEGIAQLTARSDVLYAEPNYRVHKAMVPNEQANGFFSKQWGLENTGQKLTGDWGTITGTPEVDIGVVTAWDVSTGDGSVIVATIDTGIEYDHEDLAANIWLNPGESGSGKETNGIDDDDNGFKDDWHGWNFVADSNDPKDDDLDTNFFPAKPLGHGSHVAGIIGAVGDNGTGVSGINWNVKLMPLKFFSATGDGDVANAIKAMDYAVKKGARIINASYEYSGPSDQTQSEFYAIEAAGSAGVLFIAAAGNNGAGTSGSNIDTGNKIYPAAHALDNIIAVAATDPNDNKAKFSNYGVTSVDLGAPGVNIYSTVRTDRTGLDHQVGYDYMSGTSMAAPMVSGAAALVWEKYPDLTAQQVRQLLFYTVDTTAALNGLVATSGRLNLGRAMKVAMFIDPTLPAPTAPSGLTGEGQTAGARLTWVDEANNETAFIIERSLAGQSFVMVARLDADVTTYLDSNVKDGMVARYRVKAVAGINSSAYSNEVEITIPFVLSAPADLSAYADTAGINLAWTDTSSTENGFKIERRAENVTSFWEIAALPANSTGYTDTAISAGGRYYYRVYSYSTLGNSDYSNVIFAQMTGSGSSSGSSNCFIATAAFGTPFMPQVETLRTFRDRVLLTNTPGRLFVDLYYRTSPPLADLITRHDTLRAGVRTLLRPLVWLARVLTPNEAAAMGLRPAQPPVVAEDTDVVAGELLVCFRPELTDEAITAILQAEQSERLDRITSPQGTLLRIKLAPEMTTTTAQKKYSAYKEVIYAEPNRRVHLRRP